MNYNPHVHDLGLGLVVLPLVLVVVVFFIFIPPPAEFPAWLEELKANQVHPMPEHSAGRPHVPLVLQVS